MTAVAVFWKLYLNDLLRSHGGLFGYLILIMLLIN